MSETQDSVQFEFTERFQLSLTPEEKRGLNNALNRTLNDAAFYNALVKDPNKVLSEFGLNPEAIATLVSIADVLAGIPPKPVPHLPPQPTLPDVRENVPGG
jgi:hypothetical protein